MSLSASDLVFYAALLRPQDDVSPAGGGIDVNHRVAFTQLASAHTLEVLSSSAGDTAQVLTVVGRDSSGAKVQSTATLSGTTPVALSPATTFERVLTASLSANAAGTVTLRVSSAGATVGTIPPGERGVDCGFINSASAPASQIRYSKLFGKNTNGTFSLLSGQAVLTDDPGSSIMLGVANAVNDTVSVVNRKTAPAGIVFVSLNVAQNLPGTQALAPGQGIGLWLRQTRSGGASPIKSTYAITLQGDSS